MALFITERTVRKGFAWSRNVNVDLEYGKYSYKTLAVNNLQMKTVIKI